MKTYLKHKDGNVEAKEFDSDVIDEKGFANQFNAEVISKEAYDSSVINKKEAREKVIKDRIAKAEKELSDKKSALSLVLQEIPNLPKGAVKKAVDAIFD